MGLVDGLLGGGGAPTLQVVELDKGTKKLIGDQYSEAIKNNSQIAADANKGVGEVTGNYQQAPDQMQQQSAAMGGGYSDAIRNQYNQVAGKNIQNVIRSNENQASIKHAQKLRTAATSAMAQKRVEMQNYEAQMKSLMAAEKARASMLSSVLGLGGVVGGMWAGGAFKGAQHPKIGGTEMYGTDDMMEMEGSGLNSGMVG